MSAYATVEQADEYHNARTTGDAWSALSNKEALLLVASDYIDLTYVFAGVKTDYAQERAFPRNGSLTVPTAVRQAACVLALYGASVDLMANPERLESRVTVDVITVEYEQQGNAAGYIGRLRYVDALLKPYLDGGSMGEGRMIRG